MKSKYKVRVYDNSGKLSCECYADDLSRAKATQIVSSEGKKPWLYSTLWELSLNKMEYVRIG